MSSPTEETPATETFEAQILRFGHIGPHDVPGQPNTVWCSLCVWNAATERANKRVERLEAALREMKLVEFARAVDHYRECVRWSHAAFYIKEPNTEGRYEQILKAERLAHGEIAAWLWRVTDWHPFDAASVLRALLDADKEGES